MTTNAQTGLRALSLAAYQEREAAEARELAETEGMAITRLWAAMQDRLDLPLHGNNTIATGELALILDGMRFQLLNDDLEALVSCPRCGTPAKEWRAIKDRADLGYWLTVADAHKCADEAEPAVESDLLAVARRINALREAEGGIGDQLGGLGDWLEKAIAAAEKEAQGA